MNQFYKINRVIPKNGFVNKTSPTSLHPTTFSDKLIIKPPNQQQQQNINSVEELNEKFKSLHKPYFTNLKSSNNINQNNNSTTNSNSNNSINSNNLNQLIELESTLINYPINNYHQIELSEEFKIKIEENKLLLSEGRVYKVLNNFQKLIQQQNQLFILLQQSTINNNNNNNNNHINHNSYIREFEEQQRAIDELFSVILSYNLATSKDIKSTIEFFKNTITLSNFNNYLSSFSFIQFLRELYKKSTNNITIVNKIYKSLIKSNLIDLRLNFIFSTFYLETKNELLAINLFKNNFKIKYNINSTTSSSSSSYPSSSSSLSSSFGFSSANNNNNNRNNNSNFDLIKINNIKNNIFKIDSLKDIWNFNNNQILFLNEPLAQYNTESKEYLKQLEWVNKLFTVSSKGNHFKFYQLIYELFIPSGIINSTTIAPSFINHLNQCLVNNEIKYFNKLMDQYKEICRHQQEDPNEMSNIDTIKAQIIGIIYFYCYFNGNMNKLKEAVYNSFIGDDIKYSCENNYTRFKEIIFNTFITCSLEVGQYGEALRFSDIKRIIIKKSNKNSNEKHYTVGFRDDFYSPFINFHMIKKDKTSEHFWISKGKDSIKINLPAQRITYKYNSQIIIEETDRLSGFKTTISQNSNFQQNYSQLKSINENNPIIKRESKYGLIEDDSNFVEKFSSYLFKIDKEIINNLKIFNNINDDDHQLEHQQQFELQDQNYNQYQLQQQQQQRQQKKYKYLNNSSNNNNYQHQQPQQQHQYNNNNQKNINFNNNKYFDINNYNNNKNNFIINLIYNNSNNDYGNLNYSQDTSSSLFQDVNNYYYYDIPHSNLFIKSIQRLKNHFNKKEKKSDYLLFVSKLSNPLQDLINSNYNEWFDFLYIQSSDLKLMKKILPKKTYLSKDFYNFWLQTISSYNDFNTLEPCMQLLEYMLRYNITIYQRSIKSFSFLLFQNTQPLKFNHLNLINQLSKNKNLNVGDALDDLKLKLKFYPTNSFDEFYPNLDFSNINSISSNNFNNSNSSYSFSNSIKNEILNVMDSILNSKYLSRNLIELYVNLASRVYPIQDSISNFKKWELIYYKFFSHETKEELLVNQKAYVFSVCSSLIRSSMNQLLKEFINKHSNVFGSLHQKKIIDITSHLEINDQAHVIQNLVKPQKKYYTYFVDFIKKLKSSIDNPLDFPIFDLIISKEIPYTNNDLNNFFKNFSKIYYEKC